VQSAFLDEPTVGLDPQTRSNIWSYTNELRAREHITMFWTTRTTPVAMRARDHPAISSNSQSKRVRSSPRSGPRSQVADPAVATT